MYDYISYLIAQQLVADNATEALPDRPIQADPEPGRPARLIQASRYHLSVTFRWMADILEPKHQRPASNLTCPSEG